MAPFTIFVLLAVMFANSAITTRKAVEERRKEFFLATSTSAESNRKAVQNVSTHATTTIIVFGDSITAGYGINSMDAYPAVLERKLRDVGYAVTVINSGVSGETSAGGLSRAEFVASQKPDIVILALGGNDMLRGIDPTSTRRNLAGIIETLKRSGATVILAGMRASANLGDAYVKQFDAIYPSLAREFDVPLVPFLLEGVALDPKLNQRDGIHPNEEGARVIAEQNILPMLLSLLSSQQ